MKPKPYHNAQCPNCRGAATQTAKLIFCEQCDTVFKQLRSGGFNVRRMGIMEKHEGRLRRLEHLTEKDEGDHSGLWRKILFYVFLLGGVYFLETYARTKREQDKKTLF